MFGVSVIVALGRSRRPVSLNQGRNPRRNYYFVESFNHEDGQPASDTSQPAMKTANTL